MLSASESDCYSHSLAPHAQELTEVADTWYMQALPTTNERTQAAKTFYIQVFFAATASSQV